MKALYKRKNGAQLREVHVYLPVPVFKYLVRATGDEGLTKSQAVTAALLLSRGQNLREALEMPPVDTPRSSSRRSPGSRRPSASAPPTSKSPSSSVRRSKA